MRSNVTAHPEAMLRSIMDVQQPIEERGERCKILVMSTRALKALMDEDKEEKYVHMASVDDILAHGNTASIFGALIYTDHGRTSYDIDAFGKDCIELRKMSHKIWESAQEVAAGV